MRAIVLLTVVLALGICASASAGVVATATVTEPQARLTYTEIRYTALPRERNAVTVSVTGDAWEIRDAGATVIAGAGCVDTGQHSARCRKPAPLRFALTIATGDRDDTVAIPDAITAAVDGGAGNDVLRGNGLLDGGPGDDRVLGGRAGREANSLVGGTGDDVVRGGGGRDILTGGGVRSRDLAREGNDELDGGGGRDAVSYSTRTRPVTVDLAARRGGGRGERDVLRRIEVVGGGSGNDVLRGDSRRNRLNGAGGNDILFGRGGNDILGGGLGTDLLVGGGGDDTLLAQTRGDRARGGPGDDAIELDAEPRVLACGTGNDLLGVLAPSRLLLDGVRLVDCERVRLAAFVIAIAPRRRAGALVLPARCGAAGTCGGSVTLRLLRGSGGSTPLGRVIYALERGRQRTVRVALGAADRRRLDRAPRARIEIDVRTTGGGGMLARWHARAGA